MTWSEVVNECYFFLGSFDPIIEKHVSWPSGEVWETKTYVTDTVPIVSTIYLLSSRLVPPGQAEHPKMQLQRVLLHIQVHLSKDKQDPNLSQLQ